MRNVARNRGTSSAFAIILSIGSTCSAADAGAQFLAEGKQPSATARSITYDDLIGIVDLGASPEMDFDGVAVSPDQRYVAVETAQSSVANNNTQIRWRVVSLGGTHTSTDVGSGGAPAILEDRRPQRPVWLRDSKWIVYRAKFGAVTQLWRSRVDGALQERLTWADADVTNFAVSPDGERLVYATAGSPAPMSANSEMLRGYLYDKRFSPLLSLKPIDNDVDSHGAVWALSLSDRKITDASPADREMLEQAFPNADDDFEAPIRWKRRAGVTNAAVWLVDSRGGNRADPENPLTVVRTRINSEKPIRCSHERCTGYFKGLWISADGKTVYFLRWAGRYSYGEFGLYAWSIEDASVREILRTYDSMEACSLVGSLLVCSHETATTPKALQLIDLASGKRKTIYDPNPDFHHIRFGEVVPLTWTDETGVEAYGRLVKPVDYVPGRRYPLVVVQYRSRGFLRGGTGDECPIHVLATKGFAVLSFHRPEDWEVLADYTTVENAETRFWKDLHDRRRVASTLRAGVRKLHEMGIIDPARVGIHGLSDGANTAGFLLIHHPLDFAAASVAGTYWNPILYHLFGPKLQDRMSWFDLPFPDYTGAKSQWQRISIAMNAQSLRTPLLIQVADSELLPETETFTALQAHEKPVEMYVFPDEFHVKVQPAHRLSVYVRNVQWFQFWLQNVEDANPIDPGQYARWQGLRSVQEQLSQQNQSARGVRSH